MADLRALLAAERKTRQVSHPYASYDKSGGLSCIACDLKIPSEKLWEPHLRSANHRKNALARDESRPVSKKRKIGSDDADGISVNPSTEAVVAGEKRIGKRTKSVRFAVDEVPEVLPAPPEILTFIEEPASVNEVPEPAITSVDQDAVESESRSEINAAAPDPVDEDEWAAFERDIAPLTQPSDAQQRPAADGDDRYAAATISAPAVSAAGLAQRQKQTQRGQSDGQDSKKTKRRDYEAEAQDEREDEETRIAEEADVMEEMEEKVKRLREMRERLRPRKPGETGDGEVNGGLLNVRPEEKSGLQVDGDDKKSEEDKIISEDEDDGDDLEDWFS